jgi:hypothetical protein
MTSNRANLDDLNQNSSYLVLAIFLFILSLIGGFFLYRQNQAKIVNTPAVIPTIAPTPTIKPAITIAPSASPSVNLKPSPTLKLTPTLKPTITPKATPTEASAAAGPTPTFSTLTSSSNKFTVPYQSYRKLYQDKELSGDRYTLYSTRGNFAVHVGTGWSWSNGARAFSSTLKVAGQNTFVYDISDQKIIDFQYAGLNYTVQCIHNGVQSLKDECTRLLSDFKLL